MASLNYTAQAFTFSVESTQDVDFRSLWELLRTVAALNALESLDRVRVFVDTAQPSRLVLRITSKAGAKFRLEFEPVDGEHDLEFTSQGTTWSTDKLRKIDQLRRVVIELSRLLGITAVDIQYA